MDRFDNDFQRNQYAFEEESKHLHNYGGRKDNVPRFSSAFQAIRIFDRLTSSLYLLRSRQDASHAEVSMAEDYVSTAAHRLVMYVSKDDEASASIAWYVRYQAIWRANLSFFMVIVVLFVATSLIGWNIGTAHPSLVPVILSQDLMERIIEHRSWFKELNEAPFIGGFQIAWNNINVTINCFLGGALFGVGGLIILGFNGLLFGAVMGFCYTQGFHRPLTEFVIAHGPLELTIIACGAFASVLYGRVFFSLPYTNFRPRLAKAAGEAFTVMLGVLPWLILAGFVEGFVSPSDVISDQVKLLVGLIIATFFWIFTLAPLHRIGSRPKRGTQ